MKIAIISINIHTLVLNFASPLHTVCFQKFLKEHGYEATVIDYKPCYYPKNIDIAHPFYRLVKKPPKSHQKLLRETYKWLGFFYEREVRYKKFQEFAEKYFIKTDRCWTWRDLDKEDPGFDCYLCVTDIIWKWNKSAGFDKGFFLASKSMEGKKKIAYSASRGASTYPKEQEDLFLKYISDFDAISVREKSLKDYIDNLSNLNVEQVLDPVFFQKADFYRNMMVEPKNAPKEDYILIYIVMDPADEMVRKAIKFAEKHGLRVIELSEEYSHKTYPEGTEHEVIYDIGVEEWLWYMNNAKYIFTNSFHACVLSIILHKQFFAGQRVGDKINSVLEIFGLSDRRTLIEDGNKYSDEEDVERLLKMNKIDFAITDRILEKEVSRSKKWILDVLKEVEGREHKPLLPQKEIDS